MQFLFKPKKKSMMLCITIKTNGEQEIMVSVCDPSKPYTYYFKSSGVINGTKQFYVRLPMTPDVALLRIFNVRNGNQPYGKDNSFKVLDMKQDVLTNDLNVFDSKNEVVTDFLKFFITFSERAGYLATSDKDLYESPDRTFSIRYLDVIRDDEGMPINSSARVNASTGIMDYSKYYFKFYTIPERILIGTHEFSHFYVNRDARNEFEADRNGLMIYLGLGFPRKEALQGWLKVFGRAKTGQNARRYAMIEEYVRNFDKVDKIIK
jgi:hypothetical protein